MEPSTSSAAPSKASNSVTPDKNKQDSNAIIDLTGDVSIIIYLEIIFSCFHRLLNILMNNLFIMIL